MSILDISKIVMYEFWYDYVKPKYQDKAKLCYINSFLIYIITEDFYKNIADDVEKWFDTSNHSEDDKRPFLIGNNKSVIGLLKYELGGNIMKEFVGPRAKTWVYLIDGDSEHKKAKGTKIYVIKRGLMFKNYTDCLLNNKIILR